MEIMKRPYTIEEMKEKQDEDGFVTGCVAVPLTDVIDYDLEGFLDLLAIKLVDNETLMDIRYELVGTESSDLLIKVTGNVSEILELEGAVPEFYIVPNTTGFVDVIEAQDENEALSLFAQNMDSDMSAYFKAQKTKPAVYPHGYAYADGNFEVAMSIIMACVNEHKEDAYYTENALDGLDLSDMPAIAKLQQSYDILKGLPAGKIKYRKQFYRNLQKLTGFKFDK